MSTPNAPQSIISLLEEGIQASRMKSASFGSYTEEIREATRLYRQTWVEGPLLVALAYLKGDIDERHVELHWLLDTRKIDEDIKNPQGLIQ